jgi:putative component of membrane protein insertase Oxa1/YidC/SpoIIIJ protein YidD
MNLNVALLSSLIFIFPLTVSSSIVSGIDHKFKLSKLTHTSKKIKAKSSSVSFYQKVLRQTLGSNCDLYPHDSKYAQINFTRCNKTKSILKSMHRFYMEPDASTVGLDIILKNKVYYVDMPTNCNMY